MEPAMTAEEWVPLMQAPKPSLWQRIKQALHVQQGTSE